MSSYAVVTKRDENVVGVNNSLPTKENVTLENVTRRPLSTGVFSATRLLQKKYGEGENRTNDLLAGKHEKISMSNPSFQQLDLNSLFKGKGLSQ